MIMSLKLMKIKFQPRIKLEHNITIYCVPTKARVANCNVFKDFGGQKKEKKKRTKSFGIKFG